MKAKIARAVKSTRIGREALRRLRPMPVADRGKMEMVGALGRRLGLRHYLEICATTTGNKFHRLDRDHFRSARRLVYLSDGGHTDGRRVDFAVAGEEIAPVLETIRRDGPVPDIALIDSYHSYALSRRDLEEMLALIPEGGVLVVHDCLPPDRAHAAPDHKPHAWCGLSHQAWIDVALTAPGTDYLTVDCDYGCGVLAKGRRIVLPGGVPPRPGADLAARWLGRGTDLGGAWDLFWANRRALLRLVPPAQFYRGLRLAPL